MQADNSTVFFGKMSGGYDKEFSDGFCGTEQRNCIHRYLLQWVFQKKKSKSNPRILELNGGTGTDALFLHSLGCHVLYSDGSPEMVAAAGQKFTINNALIDSTVINLNDLPVQENKYDLVFSNFSGLNCISPDQLSFLFKWVHQQLNPDGEFIAVVFGTNPMFERLFFAFTFNIKGFYRRRKTYLESGSSSEDKFPVYYYSPSYMKSICQNDFNVVHIRPIGFFIPPGFLSTRIEKYKKFGKSLLKGEEWVSKFSFLANASDHYLIHFKKRS
jgi:SAM-dependent methyltransferase